MDSKQNSGKVKMKKMTVSRAEKNCNPGNIRQSTDLFNGEIRPSRDPEFKQFRDMNYGFRAMWSVLKSYYYRHGLYTIREIINRWAPPTDHNPSEAYIRFVSEHSGKEPKERLRFNYEGMSGVVMAMARFETGSFHKEWEANCKHGYEMLFRRKIG